MDKTTRIPVHGDLNDTLGQPARKRLFIGLIVGASAIVCCVLALLWVIPFVGFANIHPAAPWVFGALVLALILIVGWASLGLVVNIMTGRTLPFFRRMRGLTVKLFLPLMTLLGKFLGFTKQEVRASFIKVNNELVEGEAGTYPASKILLLMPHCLQRSTCSRRLTYDIRNCKRCGKCPIDGLIGLSDRYGIELAIATGGTIARRIVVQKRPRLILAVACERDLAEGIQDTYPLPVFGVLNERPNGPCLDTLVALPRLEEAIRRFLAPDDIAAAEERAQAASAKTTPDDHDAPVRAVD
ncbi:protein of unknown function DUF116 [Desulfovibrio sp. X2]|uniref:DUF116 domain-containing protein n=1 Tax=Desulfovibrio sp. X2 TaxID=941449 RepID=UPI0003589836|nr:DUF116 domain-containing protein [Desulfovibrio sp. X2]EPR44004.1 protein of unknown function DUF116 [Desulfovibrio sp. X2]